MNRDTTSLLEQLRRGEIGRRQFIKAAGLLGLSMGAIDALLAGCAPTPQVVKETVVVEKEVEVTKVVEVEKEVEKEVVVTATPEPTAVPATGPKKGGVLHISLNNWPKVLHPVHDSGTEGLYVQKQIRDGLYNVGEDGQMTPGLAVGHEQPDDVTYIFHLREGVKFHDGSDFTADDVIWTLDLLRGQTPIKSTHAAWAEPAIASYEALDDYTVKVVLSEPWIDFIPMMWADKNMSITKKDYVLKLGDDFGHKGDMGTGPFMFKEWVKGERLVLERNPNYWGAGDTGMPYVDEIEYRAIGEGSTNILSFLTGETDIMLDPPLKDVTPLQGQEGVRVQHVPAGDEKYMELNTTIPPFDNKKVRQAIHYGIDRQTIMDVVYYGWAVPSQGTVPPQHWAYPKDADFYPYDPDKAASMLAEEGYTKDNPLEFEILTVNVTEYVDIATLIQNQMGQIGVVVTVTPMEKSGWVSKVWPVEGTANPAFQASVYRSKGHVVTTNYTFRRYHSTGNLNSVGLNQPGGAQRPELDDILQQAWGEMDQAKARELYLQANEILMDEAVYVSLGWQENINVSYEYVKDLPIFMQDTMPLRGVWLDV